MENVNPIIASLLADAPHIGIHEAVREHQAELAGHFDSDPVAEHGQESADQARDILDILVELM